MRKFIILLSFFAILGLSFPKEAFAKKLLPRAKPATTSGKTVSATSTKGVATSVKFRGDRLAIVITFSNLSIASSVSYTLSYNTRGTTQGAGGTIDPALSGNLQTRELLFGTCSHGVCRYDRGITNAKFVVTTTLGNGRRIVKSFRLKV